MFAALPINEDVPKHDTSTQTRLRGRWLWAARVVWVAVVALGVGMYAASLPLAAANLHTICQATPCPTLEQLLPDEAAGLQQYGLSLDFYATYITVILAVFPLVFVVAALLIFWRRSDDWMALFTSLTLATFGVTAAPAIEALVATTPAWHWPLALMELIGWGSFIILFYLFPSGRFVPRWTRWLAVLWAIVIAAFTAQGRVFSNQFFFVVILCGLGTSAGAQIYRYRRASTPVQRQQTKWIVLGFSATVALITIGFLPVLFVPAIGAFGLAGKLYNAVRVLFFAVIPLTLFLVSVAFSMLRYRLWDVDFVINRALVLGIMALLFILIAAGSLFALSQIAVNLPGGPLVGVAVGAAIFGIAFNPVYKECRTFVDRLYGIKLDYVEALKAYGGTQRVAHKTGGTKDSFGSYTGLTLLGRGGMGEVYRAQHPTLHRAVAIKILPEHVAGKTDAEKRFLREAQTIAKLKHPNIITLHDVGEQDGKPYMVMEYVDGQDLSELIQDRGRLSADEAVPILSDIASALDHAHENGVVHRDIKPSNVMIEKVTATGGKTQRAVLMDFGIAKSYAAGTKLTQTGMIGTLDYISPEQIQGASEVDARADIYSLGVMAYQMLTGKLPFEHNNPGAMVMAHLMQPAPNPCQIGADLPESACLAILRAMSKKPEQRFASAGEFVSAMAAG